MPELVALVHTANNVGSLNSPSSYPYRGDDDPAYLLGVL